jgi:hypothetical protein
MAAAVWFWAFLVGLLHQFELHHLASETAQKWLLKRSEFGDVRNPNPR